ncbi:FMN-dependent dehydrogenase [Desulfonema limicola]|uniref:FMN-dependent dehydrogenase n=1 Tax=Desulfonema limicola TaxID=45656 RepID=A0A975GHI5_9BACT|nr:alpha-hydroxy-acid oxidizing protein [Desulfonema limicola]QTA81506.1 FMN-dependent dehydrogenase [Desulfonema limicola]
MKEIRETAKKNMQGYCRVCAVCNGKSCAGEVPGMGGIGTGSSFTANIESLSALRFNMRLIHDIQEPDTRVSILGKSLDIPVLAAPIGGVSFNMGGRISEEDYINAVLEGCYEKNTLGCVGDGVPGFIHETGYAAIKKLNGKGIPFIKPWEDREFLEKLEKAAATGADIMGMDIDAAGLITLKLMGRPVSPKSPDKLADIIEMIKKKTSMKFILKGIMTPDEAVLAVKAGADAIAVSNHGGRVLDHVPGAAEVLPGIADAVKGRITILADGGIRTGGDVLKMLALGADAIMIGRPFSIAALGGLKKGVIKYLEQIKSELVSAMVLTGCKRVTHVSRSILYKSS